MTNDAVRAAVDTAYRDEWGQIVATLIGLTHDWDLAEDCAQEAFAAALATWPRDGIRTGRGRGSPPLRATARLTGYGAMQRGGRSCRNSPCGLRKRRIRIRVTSPTSGCA